MYAPQADLDADFMSRAPVFTTTAGSPIAGDYCPREALLTRPTWINTTSTGMRAKGSVVGFCSGAGGFDLGFVRAGFASRAAIEMNEHAAATYAANFPRATVIAEPVEAVSNERLLRAAGGEPVDVVIAGLPCQSFSTSGKQDGQDGRAWLFLQIPRILEILEPVILVIENVPAIITAHEGRFINWLLASLAEVGYTRASLANLNAAAYRVPQTRERLIIIVNRCGKANLFPHPILSRPLFRTVDEAIGDLEAYPPDPGLNHEPPDHGEDMIARLESLPPGESPYGRGEAMRRLHAHKPASTLKHNNGGSAVHPQLPRALTVREMARLQSFPDSFRFHGPVSQQRIQVANAVPPEMARHIALAVGVMLEEIRER